MNFNLDIQFNINSHRNLLKKTIYRSNSIIHYIIIKDK